MRYDYDWPIRYPHPVLDEALEIALDYLQGTGQAKPGGFEHVVAAAILAAWSQRIKHRIRLANAGIRAVEQAHACAPDQPADLRGISLRERFFDC